MKSLAKLTPQRISTLKDTNKFVKLCPHEPQSIVHKKTNRFYNITLPCIILVWKFGGCFSYSYSRSSVDYTICLNLIYKATQSLIGENKVHITQTCTLHWIN